MTHLFKASDKLREYEKSLDILGERNSYSKADLDATFMRLKEDAIEQWQIKPAIIKTRQRINTGRISAFITIQRTPDLQTIFDKAGKTWKAKQSNCRLRQTQDQSSEENYGTWRWKRCGGICKSTGSTKNSINLSRKMSLSSRISTIIKTKTITSVPWDNT